MSVYRVVGDKPILNILLYGEPGTGKTTLAASAQDHPDMKNVLIYNIEGGLLSVAHRGDIHAVDVKSTEELKEEVWKIQQGQYGSVNTVVIDSVTELQSINLDEIVAAAMEKQEKNARQSRSRKGNLRTEDDIWQDDYGRSTKQLKRIFRQFRDLPVHVVFTALAKFVYPKMPEGTDMTLVEPMTVVPNLTAKLSSSLLGFMDMNWYSYVDPEDNKFKILTQKQGPYHAKTRGRMFAEALGPVVENPTLGALYEKFIATETQKRKKKSTANS